MRAAAQELVRPLNHVEVALLVCGFIRNRCVSLR